MPDAMRLVESNDARKKFLVDNGIVTNPFNV
jgi:hypothetical protein